MGTRNFGGQRLTRNSRTGETCNSKPPAGHRVGDAPLHSSSATIRLRQSCFMAAARALQAVENFALKSAPPMTTNTATEAGLFPHTGSQVLRCAAFVATFWMSFGIAHGQMELLVTNYTNGPYTIGGATINSASITGLSYPTGIAFSGSNVFVANLGTHSTGVDTL